MTSKLRSSEGVVTLCKIYAGSCVYVCDIFVSLHLKFDELLIQSMTCSDQYTAGEANLTLRIHLAKQ